jgi:hypothetical protein
MEAMAEARLQESPPDHPIYSEGPSITFIRLETKPKAKAGQPAKPVAENE